MHLRVPIEEPVQRPNYTSTALFIVIIKKRKFSKATKLANTHEASHLQMQRLCLINYLTHFWLLFKCHTILEMMKVCLGMVVT